MSFSAEIKEELSKMSTLANKNNVKAELIGYLITSNVRVLKNKIQYATENEYNINRFHKLLDNLGIDYTIKLQGKNYIIELKKVQLDEITYLENDIKLNNADGLDDKAIVRGSFLGSGSLNNPNNTYHLELLFPTEENAKIVMKIIEKYTINSKLLERKNKYAIYIKDSEEISKFLAMLGANVAVLKFEEIRVVKETRNNINRIVNCETANLNKTIDASVKQIEDIKFLKKIKKFDTLPDNLKAIAELRLQYPDASLIELTELFGQTIGKSGIHHRLKKISQIAEEYRK